MNQSKSQQELCADGHTRFSVKARFRSFTYAWAGILHFFKTGHNAQVHLAASVVATMLAVWYRINAIEVVLVSFSVALVWITEMINTAIEKTIDFITLEKRPQIKQIKDVAAGAVLVASVASVVTAAIVFIPKIISS